MRRQLSRYECFLLEFFIQNANEEHHHLLKNLEAYEVEDFEGEKIAGFRILSEREDKRIFGECIAETEYTDEDGVAVSIGLNLDDSGELYELDVWKVNDTALISWPKLDELEFKGLNF